MRAALERVSTKYHEPAGLVLMDAGVSDYQTIHESQLELVRAKKNHDLLHDYLIFVEHPDVYTYGRKSKGRLAVPGVSVERGGEVTFHNPGQLVCYPILRLREDERDIHGYLRRLEWTLIDTLSDFGLKAERRSGFTGVWVCRKEKKIASVGVAISGWVTYHGCALNVSNDLSGFARIQPCGLSAEVMTSMSVELRNCPAISEVKESFLWNFSRQMNRALLV